MSNFLPVIIMVFILSLIAFSAYTNPKIAEKMGNCISTQGVMCKF